MISTDGRWAVLASAAVTVACLMTGCRAAETPAPASEPAADAWPRTYTDALGETATLSAAPRRIVSLAPAVTEMLFAVGAGDRVVGVTSLCNYPPQAADLPTVGTYTGFSVETVLEMRPDIALGMRGTSKESFGALRKAGVPVLAYDPVSVGGVLDVMEEIGRMIQDAPGEVQAVAALRARVQVIEEQAGQLPRRPQVLCAVQVEPLYAAGPDNHIDDMIRTAGGENAAGDANISWPQYSLERMLEKDPEVIVIPTGYDAMGVDTLKALKASDAWARTTAVRRDNVLAIPDDLLTLPGPRVVDGLEMMAEAVQRAAVDVAGAALGNGGDD